MKRAAFVLTLLTVFLSLNLFDRPSAMAQDAVPTLVPPTLVPSTPPASDEILQTESAVARLQRDGRVRAGILYNEPPFAELNIRGDLSGYDADLIRSMAEAWGVEVEFVQVTRQTAVEALQRGEIDVLAGGQVHRREFDAAVEFSQTYYVGKLAMMVRADDGAATLMDLANRSVGVVIGTVSQRALAAWSQANGANIAMVTFPTLDRAFAGLMMGQVDGIVGSDFRLLQVVSQPDQVRILEEAVQKEPHALAARRQDAPMRDLINQTLQYLVQNNRLSEIHQAHLAGSAFTHDTIPLWMNLSEEAPKPASFAVEITYPAQYVVPRVMSSGTIRVAGTMTLPEDAPESQRRLEQLNRTLIERMAQQWGLAVEYIPDSAGNALELVANGQADIAVGVDLDWAWADRVDFSGPYLLHGQRLMVQTNSQIEGFLDLRGGKWVAVANNEPEIEARAVDLATSVNARIQVYFTREQDLAFSILVDKNADVAFGDSLKLIPAVQANPDQLMLTQREQVDSWYSRDYVAFAVPHNDPDWRLMVDYALQDMIRDGTLNALLLPVMLPDEIPTFDVWPD